MSTTTQSAEKPLLQGQDWSGAMGEKWNHWHERFEAMLAPIGAATLTLAACKQGERVLDIGCGAGATTFALAKQVGAGGQVLGLDISSALVQTAATRARQQGVTNANFLCGDAATIKLSEGGYDCLFSRFGVMFFADPFAAFRNLRLMLREGARVVFCCWGPPPENPWVSSLSAVVSRHISLPPPDPLAPGPFAFADQVRTRSILEQAGFEGITFTPWHGRQVLGGPGLDLDAVVNFAEKAFFVGDVLEGKPEHLRQQVLADVRGFLRDRQTENGVELDAMAWLVSASCSGKSSA